MSSPIAPRLMAIAFAALIAGAVGTAAPAHAAGSGEQQAQNSAQQSTPDFSDAKLEAFAVAAAEVSALMNEWAPKVKEAQKAGEKEKAQKLAGEVRNKAKAAIADTDGITVDEYTKIAQAARQDKELNQKVMRMVREKQNQQ